MSLLTAWHEARAGPSVSRESRAAVEAALGAGWLVRLESEPEAALRELLAAVVAQRASERDELLAALAANATELRELRDSSTLPEPPRTRRSSRHKSPTTRLATPTGRRFQQVATQLINDVASNKYALMFLAPVSEDDAENYYDVVRQPVDLKGLKQAVRSGEVTELAEIELRLQLMFTNAIMYNRNDTEVFRWATEMMEDTKAVIDLYKGAM